MHIPVAAEKNKKSTYRLKGKLPLNLYSQCSQIHKQARNRHSGGERQGTTFSLSSSSSYC